MGFQEGRVILYFLKIDPGAGEAKETQALPRGHHSLHGRPRPARQAGDRNVNPNGLVTLGEASELRPAVIGPGSGGKACLRMNGLGLAGGSANGKATTHH